MWEAKLEEARACRQQMYDYLADALQLFPVDEGQLDVNLDSYALWRLFDRTSGGYFEHVLLQGLMSPISFTGVWHQIWRQRQEWERFLLPQAGRGIVPEGIGPFSFEVTQRDFLKAALQPEILRSFNPFLRLGLTSLRKRVLHSFQRGSYTLADCAAATS